MAYTGAQATLVVHAAKYARLGYSVGYAMGKSLVGQYEDPDNIFGQMMNSPKMPNEWDGISIILDDVVCVDFDQDFVDIGWGRPLPPTLKEKSPRGYHLFYLVPSGKTQGRVMVPKVRWQPHVDLLCRSHQTKKTKYEEKGKVSTWGGHIICAPTPGYKTIYPDIIPDKDKLVIAPDWLIDELCK